ncbi:hypothetical protein [Microcoleus sp. bin38.metabat.b11b12b14.051]|uniref:hypothetical protein n=1 Tax=Microcoleus sp. bin38.metabat.b11b12b14.051 TaxID=2742709 RepID=UPI0025DDE9AA|nr:hypothetical protein [Microcoleus sp. bin38.metabat.b11b12b14.051]
MSSVGKISTRKTIRGVDIKLRYSLDDGGEGLVNQRQYFDDSGSLSTPITPALLTRQVTGFNSPGIERVGKIEPRHIITCFASQTNLSGESNFKVVIPYAPGDPGHIEQIQEIAGFQSQIGNPLSLAYYGESS